MPSARADGARSLKIRPLAPCVIRDAGAARPQMGAPTSKGAADNRMVPRQGRGACPLVFPGIVRGRRVRHVVMTCRQASAVTSR